MTALDLPDDAELTARQCGLLRNLPLNVFRMAARAPDVLEPFQALTVAVLHGGELDIRTKEILVLRIAHLTGAGYEREHHRRIARGAGLTEDMIERLNTPGEVTGLEADDDRLVRVADRITRHVRLGEQLLAELADRYTAQETTEIIFCCAFYNMVSRFLESTQVPLEVTPPQLSGPLGELG